MASQLAGCKSVCTTNRLCVEANGYVKLKPLFRKESEYEKKELRDYCLSIPKISRNSQMNIMSAPIFQSFYSIYSRREFTVISRMEQKYSLRTNVFEMSLFDMVI